MKKSEQKPKITPPKYTRPEVFTVQLGDLSEGNFFKTMGRMHLGQNDNEIRRGFLFAFTSRKKSYVDKLADDLYELIRNNNFTNVFLVNSPTTEKDISWMMEKPGSLIVIDLEAQKFKKGLKAHEIFAGICACQRTKQVSALFVGAKPIPLILQNADLII